MCDGVGVVRGGGGVGGAGGPSMGPEPGAHFRVAQHAGQQGRHQHGHQDDHQHVQAAHWGGVTHVNNARHLLPHHAQLT